MNLFTCSARTARTFAAVAALMGAASAQANVVTANFEGNLAGWSERDPAAPTAALVSDPLNAANKVLTFERTGSTGTLFSVDAATSASGQYTLTFDYLGLKGAGGTAGDLGGYIGVVPVQGHWNTVWLGGTGAQPTPLDLIDDGQWRTYTITFTSIWNSLSVVAQDWDNSGPAAQAARDVFFDNISLRAAATAVPEPTSLALVSLALLALAASAQRKAGAKG
jgi:hypothetical protein